MDLNVGIVQVRPVEDLDANLAFAFSKIHELAAVGAHVVVLPEMWPYPYHAKWFAAQAQPAGGSLWQRLSDTAAEEGVWLIAGSVAELRDGRIYNTCYIFDDAGRQVADYSKTHLFDADVDSVVTARESSVIAPGDHLTSFDTPWGTFGICICFDVRFSEVFVAMVNRGARVIFCPAAFSYGTGRMHWELLMRTRALETQAYMVGCNAGYDPDGPYPCYGHSIVCDPWGTVLYDAGEGEEAKMVTLDMDLVDTMRRQLPVVNSRRTDLYQLVEKPSEASAQGGSGSARS